MGMSEGFVKVKNRETLILDYDDTIILIYSLGMFDHKEWYSWTVYGPSEGTHPDYQSKCIPKRTLVEKLEAYEKNEFAPLSEADRFAIKLFLNDRE